MRSGVRAALWAVVSVACSSSDTPRDIGAPGSAPVMDAGSIQVGDLDLAVYPLHQYAGFDGTHAFQAPFGVFRAQDDLTLETSDPEAVDVTPATYEQATEAGSYFLLQPKQPGELTLTAMSRGKSVTAHLTVTAYDPASYAVGAERYAHEDAPSHEPSCASCHQEPGGPDHSPAAISAASDEQVRAVVRTGVDLSGSPITQVDHRWHADPATLDGLVTYLRSLAPRGYDPRGQSLRSWHGRVRPHSSLVQFTLGWLRARVPATFSLIRERHDALGMTHLRFVQSVRGVPVLGAEVTTHYATDGTLRSVTSTAKDQVDLDVTPSLGSEDAERIVRHAFETKYAVHDVRFGFEPLGDVGVTRLGIHARGSERRLVYEVGISSDERGPIRARARVDAHTGELVELYDDVKTVTANAPGVFGETRAIEITQGDPNFILEDLTRGQGVVTYTAQESQDLPGIVEQSKTASVWDDDAPHGVGSAVDAHFFAGVVYDFYKRKFARKGIDGHDARITSSVHYGIKYENALWEGHQMVYGDGDQFKPFAGAVDVVGHELTHGVTQSESKLEYLFQAGAINEAISDIFGALVEHELVPDDVANWQIGEKIERTPGKPLRNMANPAAAETPQPSHMQEYLDLTQDQDNGGVHLNSGIVSYCAYLMALGGTHRLSGVHVPGGLGYEKTAQLWYRVNTEYLQRQSEFVDAAQATLTAATDLHFTAAEQATIRAAWEAVGVLPSESEGPQPVLAEDGGGISSSGALGRGSDAEDTSGGRQTSACDARPGKAGSAAFGFGLLALLARRRRRA